MSQSTSWTKPVGNELKWGISWTYSLLLQSWVGFLTYNYAKQSHYTVPRNIILVISFHISNFLIDLYTQNKSVNGSYNRSKIGYPTGKEDWKRVISRKPLSRLPSDSVLYISLFHFSARHYFRISVWFVLSCVSEDWSKDNCSLDKDDLVWCLESCGWLQISVAGNTSE